MSKFRYDNRFLQKSNMAAKTGSGVLVLKQTTDMFNLIRQGRKQKYFLHFIHISAKNTMPICR